MRAIWSLRNLAEPCAIADRRTAGIGERFERSGFFPTYYLAGRPRAFCKRMRNGSPLRRGGAGLDVSWGAARWAWAKSKWPSWTAHNQRAQRCDVAQISVAQPLSADADRSAFPGGRPRVACDVQQLAREHTLEASRHSSELWIVRGIVSPRLRCFSNAAGASHRWWSRAMRIGRCRSNSNGQMQT
jgi:hypothetical protein